MPESLEPLSPSASAMALVYLKEDALWRVTSPLRFVVSVSCAALYVFETVHIAHDPSVLHLLEVLESLVYV